MTEGPDALLSRRTFLGRCVVFLGSVMAVMIGGIGGGYVLSPLFQKRQEDWVDLGSVAEMHPGSPVKVEFVQRQRDAWMTTERRSSAWVLTPDGKDFLVFDPRCTHLGCPYRWDEAQKQFLCPCHAAVFDSQGNVMAGPPPRPLDRYPWKVQAGRLLVLPRRLTAAPA